MEYRAVGTAGSTKVVWGLSLNEIARELAAPFNEEQAWGVCHQCSVKLSCLSSERVPSLQPSNVVVTAEGKVEIIAGEYVCKMDQINKIKWRANVVCRKLYKVSPTCSCLFLVDSCRLVGKQLFSEFIAINE